MIKYSFKMEDTMADTNYVLVDILSSVPEMEKVFQMQPQLIDFQDQKPHQNLVFVSL